MTLGEKEMEKLASLARVSLANEEKKGFAKDIGNILEYVSVLTSLPVKDEEPPSVAHTVLREDGKPHESGLWSEAILSSAPSKEEGYIRVKNILSSSKKE